MEISDDIIMETIKDKIYIKEKRKRRLLSAERKADSIDL